MLLLPRCRSRSQSKRQHKPSKRKLLSNTKRECCSSMPPHNRKTPMTTRKNCWCWKLAALLTLPVLQACSTQSAQQQPAALKLQVTPLPAEISRIDTSSSQPCAKPMPPPRVKPSMSTRIGLR